MLDQAHKLRELMEKQKQDGNSQNEINRDSKSKTFNKNSAKILCITSGKGGVGKSNVAVNLSLALSNLGKRVVLFDADLGMANVDILLGIRPKYNLGHIISEEKNISEILTNGPCGIKFISGGSGVDELINLNAENRTKFVSNISLLDSISDIIILDTGAGAAESVVDFALASDDIIVVTTPEPTAITDAYALIKTLVNKKKDISLNLIVNRAENEKESNSVYEKLSEVSKKFLNFDINYLGCVSYDPKVVKAVKLQQPFSLIYPNANASKSIRDIADNILRREYDGINRPTGLTSFFTRFLSYLK